VSNYISNVDSFAGNSGSGMFDGRSHEFVGILVTGGEDWVERGNCQVAHECTMSPLSDSEDGCPGEEGVSAEVLRPFLTERCASNSDCSGHGSCVGGACECQPGFYAADCSFTCDRAYCNNRGDCVGWDECACDDGALWPPLCSLPRDECASHDDCASDSYCSLLDDGAAICWECLDCDGYSCSQWGDSVDGRCATCSGGALPVPDRGAPTPEGALECGGTVQGTTVGAGNRLGGNAAEHVYSFTVSTAERVHFDSCQSTYDTHLSVMTPDCPRPPGAVKRP
jgi:hypothetical protein